MHRRPVFSSQLPHVQAPCVKSPTYYSGNSRASSTYKTLDQFVDTGASVVVPAGTLLVRRLSRQQPRESGAVPGSAAARSRQCHRHRDSTTFSAPGRAKTSTGQHVHHRWTNGQETVRQPCTPTDYAWQVRMQCIDFYYISRMLLEHWNTCELPISGSRVLGLIEI